MQALVSGDALRLEVQEGDDLAGLSRSLNALADRWGAELEQVVRDRDELRAIIRGMGEGVVAVDREERILHMNAMAGRLLEVTPGTGAGKRIWEVTRVLEVTDALAQTLRSGSEASAELRRVGQPRDRVIEVNTSPLRDADGHLAGAVVVLRDLTELRRLESIRRDFVANVSHELKTPITAIRGLTEMLMEDPAMPKVTQERFHAKVQAQALRLSALVSDLLTLARLESEAGVLNRKALDLRRPVHTTVRGLPYSEDRDIDLEVDVPEEPVVVVGDEEALRLVVSNLLDNAMKYTPKGGRVEVRLASEVDHAVLQVTDTGVGIEPVHHDRIFERFYRVDKARARELGGTGLGLSIVKHIALAHGGDVSVRSTPGRGSAFTVRLPLRRSNQERPADSEAEERPTPTAEFTVRDSRPAERES